jgi:hypothetical protein
MAARIVLALVVQSFNKETTDAIDAPEDLSPAPCHHPR